MRGRCLLGKAEPGCAWESQARPEEMALKKLQALPFPSARRNQCRVSAQATCRYKSVPCPHGKCWVGWRGCWCRSPAPCPDGRFNLFLSLACLEMSHLVSET